jgi:chemotaxis protein methyltransferase CheR
MLSTAPSQWETLRQWVESETGMDLAGTRFPRLRDAVEKLLDRPLADADLNRMMQPAQRARFLESVTGRLTVGESFFFRNEHHFRVLRERVLPQILRENAQSREVRIWSAGCSTGEEPYSVAILLDQLLGADGSWRVSILGTDLNPDFLARAREARYRQWSFRQTDIHKERSYFCPEGDDYRVVPKIRELVRFGYLNLVKDVYPSPMTGTAGLDLVLFRNVAIYLKPEVIAAIIGRFRQALRPGGWLLLGETEIHTAPTGGFEVRQFEQATFFQTLRDQAGLSAASSAPPLPALAAAFAFPAVTAASPPPPLPEWVPLPAVPRTKIGQGQTQRSSARSGQGAGPSLNASLIGSPRPAEGEAAWESIERCLRRREFAEAAREIDRIANANERAAVRLRSARELLATAEIAKAREMLDVCLAEDPLLIAAQLLKACFAEEAGDLEAAERHYRRALYIDRNCAIAHFHLALVQQQQRHAAGALRSLRTTMKLTAGKDPHALVDHGDGVCYGRLRELVSLLTENLE